MKKTISLFATLALAIGLFAGCTSPNGASSLTPSQVATVGVVVSQAANVGAVYAIQQNKDNAKYFVLADAAIDTLVVNSNASPTELENALSPIAGTNQLVNVAVSGALVAYDLTLSEYSITNAADADAIIWLGDIEVGFKQALASTGTTKLTVAHIDPPYYLKQVGSTFGVDTNAIKATVEEAKTAKR